MTARRSGVAACLAVVLLIGLAAHVGAQRGRGGTTPPSIPGGGSLSRLETLDTTFKLTKDQKKAIKTILDDAHKNAAAVRESLSGARAALGKAVQNGESEEAIDAAAKAYGQQAAAMAAIEMKALAAVMQALDPAQRANTAAIRSAFFLMRGVFLDAKKWDTMPGGQGY